MRKQTKLIIFVVLAVTIGVTVFTQLQATQWRNYHIVYNKFEFVAPEKDKRLSDNDLVKAMPVSADFNESMLLYMKRMRRIACTNFPPCKYFLVGTHSIDKKNNRIFALVVEEGQFKGYYLSHADPSFSGLSITKSFFFNDDKNLSDQISRHINDTKERYYSVDRRK